MTSAASLTFEQEMLEVLKANGVITQEDYDRLISKMKTEHKSVNEEILICCGKRTSFLRTSMRR